MENYYQPMVVVKPGKWLVCNKDTGIESEIEWDYLKSTLNTSYLELFDVQGWMRKKGRYIDIPPGDFKHHAEFFIELAKGPELQYCQPKGSRTCLTTSVANLLFYCNCWKHAGKVYNAQKMCKEPNLLTLFKRKLMQYLHYLKSKKVTITLNNFQEESYSEPIVISVKGSNGKEDHMVAIYTGLIYDRNFSHAVPLCKKALDY